MADRKISDLTALTTPASGDYLPIVDISEGAAASKNKRVTIQSLFQGIPVNVGIGTSSPTQLLSLAGTSANILLAGTSNSYTTYNIGASNVGYVGDANWIFAGSSSDFGIRATSNLVFGIGANERLRIDSSGRVGIGTSSPGFTAHVSGAKNTTQLFVAAPTISAVNDFTQIGFGLSTTVFGAIRLGFDNPSAITNSYFSFFNDNGSGLQERLRIDPSGRLLVGTSSARSNFYNTTATSQFQIEGTAAEAASLAVINTASSASGARLHLAKGRGGSIGSNTIVVDGDVVGQITFQANDGTEFVESASIQAFVDGTPGTNDMPGRLVFSVTADGAASPTEALRISNDRSITVSDGGNVVLGTTTGTKIGTGTTQKIGFYNATPVVQPTAVADATDAASVITQLNALLTRMRNLGLIAT